MKIVSILFVFLFLFVGCSSVQPVYNIRNYPLPGYITKYSTENSIENCIVQGGYSAGWKMIRKEKQTIVGYFSDNGKHAMVRITFTKKFYNIEYLNSINFDFDGSMINKKYNELVLNLAQNINTQINTVANKIMFEKGEVYIKKIPANSQSSEQKEI